MCLSAVLLVMVWLSGDILAEKTSASDNRATASGLHILSSLLGTGVFFVSLVCYRRATREIKKIVGIVRRELNRIHAAQ